MTDDHATDTLLGHLQAGVDELQKYIDRGRALARAELVARLTADRQEIADSAFRFRTLGRESEARQMDVVGTYISTLVSSLSRWRSER